MYFRFGFFGYLSQAGNQLSPIMATRHGPAYMTNG
jgi:hypothetical protein